MCGPYPKEWYKCKNCSLGFDLDKTACPHCGYENSEEEIELLKSEFDKKSRPGEIAALILVPIFIYVAYIYFDK